jgi:GT2 family glycosyltransferase
VGPSASILFPTRGRPDYLRVALGSVAPQARAHGAEIVVVEDDAAAAATEAVAAEHGARYLALGAPEGLNRARNAAAAAAAGDLLCYLDDDVEAWPGWLAALLAAADALPGHEAFGGPIRARLEGSRLRLCGREPAPVTTLDLGPEDRDAPLVWGANLALRRAALQRVGPFDPARSGPGDEEEWERRLTTAGGRIRYVARAGVDHRRAGADARLPALVRAGWRRGRASRRFDAEKGTSPGLAGELRTLGGCVWHTGRYACGNGIVMTAHTAGRLYELLLGGPIPPSAADPPYLSGQSGTLGRRDLLAARARDALADLLTAPRRRALRRAAASEPPRRRVLVAGVMRPHRAATAAALRAELSGSRHVLELRLAPPRAARGKWENLAAILAGAPLQDADWLLLVDDDVILPRDFLDLFLYCAERHGLQVAQPAHAFASHAAWPVTRRRPQLVARRTRFVEMGPVTAIAAAAFPALLPFPALAMGWGLDAHWSAVAADHGLALGIVDATPVRHLRPVAAEYPRAAAIAEAEAFLQDRPYITRDEAAEVLAAWR